MEPPTYKSRVDLHRDQEKQFENYQWSLIVLCPSWETEARIG